MRDIDIDRTKQDEPDRIVKFYIKDDVLFKSEPEIGYENIRKETAIIQKDAFIACYNKWIKGEGK